VQLRSRVQALDSPDTTDDGPQLIELAERTGYRFKDLLRELAITRRKQPGTDQPPRVKAILVLVALGGTAQRLRKSDRNSCIRFLVDRHSGPPRSSSSPSGATPAVLYEHAFCGELGTRRSADFWRSIRKSCRVRRLQTVDRMTAVGIDISVLSSVSVCISAAGGSGVLGLRYAETVAETAPEVVSSKPSIASIGRAVAMRA